MTMAMMMMTMMMIIIILIIIMTPVPPAFFSYLTQNTLPPPVLSLHCPLYEPKVACNTPPPTSPHQPPGPSLLPISLLSHQFLLHIVYSFVVVVCVCVYAHMCACVYVLCVRDCVCMCIHVCVCVWACMRACSNI